MTSGLQRLKIIFFLLLLTTFGRLSAQCDHIGLVGNGLLLGEFNCELLIISSDGAAIFQPVKPSEALTIGKVIRFSYEVLDSTGCSEDVPLINITCFETFISNEECPAEFLAFPNDIFFSREYVFEPLLFDSTKTYQWDFGDGQQSTEAQTTHLYTTNGDFTVCLTVSDGDLCTQTTCDTLSVGTPILNTCNFSIEDMAISDSTYQLEVFSQIDFGPYRPQTVQWYEYETGKLLGDSAVIIYQPASNSAPLVNICAEITVEYPDGSTCAGTVCHTLVMNENFTGQGTCKAIFGYLPHSASSELDGTIDFYNLSFGDYTSAAWNFGDGASITSLSEIVSHTYETQGLYEACLILSDSLNNCADTLCLPVFTVGGAEICNFNDCVLPGDANKDGTVNIFDALNIGVGFNSTGEVRPNAVINPILQAAFDWVSNTTTALNFKHIDCDGNGIVNELDYLAIDQNYQKVENKVVTGTDENLPTVTLKFATDTIRINPNSPTITIPASLEIGSTDRPIENFYGVALSLDYDGQLIKEIQTTYNEESFVGDGTTILTRQKNDITESQVGIVVTQTDHQGIDGNGDIAQVGFVVDHDIIELKVIPVTIDIGDLTVVDPNGEKIPVNVTADVASVVLILDESFSVSTEEQLTETQFEVYPNPATETLNISIGSEIDLLDGRIEIFNTLGQQILTQEIDYQMNLKIQHLESGVYWVKIHTNEGVGIKKISVK